MKKKVFLLVVTSTFLIILGCSNSDVKETETETETEIVNVTEEVVPLNSLEQEVIARFKAIGDSETVDILQMHTLLMNNVAKISPENVDLMLLVYEEALIQVLPSYEEAFFVDDVQTILLSYSLEDILQNKVKEENIRALLTESSTLGYKIQIIEYSVSPYMDYSYFEQFASYATNSSRDFYILMKEESDNPPQIDAVLNISWDDVLQRGINFEDYLKKYPESYHTQSARIYFKDYKKLAIMGTANVQIFDYFTNEMTIEAKEAYIAFVDQGIQTEFAEFIKTFLSLIEKHAFIKTVEVDDFINQQK